MGGGGGRGVPCFASLFTPAGSHKDILRTCSLANYKVKTKAFAIFNKYEVEK
jgi:hypothetical protein